MKKILVTGCSKGIGKELCLQLAKQPSNHVILTCRSKDQGKQLLEEFNGFKNVVFHPLDVTKTDSIKELKEFTKSLGKIDYLINNAGIGTMDPKENLRISKDIIDTNYKGVRDVTNHFLEQMNDSGRVVFISSMLGKIDSSYALKKEINQVKNIQELDSLVQEFLKDVENNKLERWPKHLPATRVSKAAVNLLSKLYSLNSNSVEFVSLCPGWVRTSMGGDKAKKTVDKAADDIIWTMNHSENVNGKFYSEKKEIVGMYEEFHK